MILIFVLLLWNLLTGDFTFFFSDVGPLNLKSSSESSESSLSTIVWYRGKFGDDDVFFVFFACLSTWNPSSSSESESNKTSFILLSLSSLSSFKKSSSENSSFFSV